MFIRDPFDNAVQLLDFSDIYAAVGEGCAEFGLGPLLDSGKVARGRLEPVEGVNCEK
jgi:hypothetical protein